MITTDNRTVHIVKVTGGSIILALVACLVVFVISGSSHLIFGVGLLLCKWSGLLAVLCVLGISVCSFAEVLFRK